MVGVLQRFEHRLQEMYDGGFARAFKSELQPTEIAGAVQREMDDRAAIVAQGRTLVPNDFVAEIAQADYGRLEVYADNLGLELATLAEGLRQGSRGTPSSARSGSGSRACLTSPSGPSASALA